MWRPNWQTSSAGPGASLGQMLGLSLNSLPQSIGLMQTTNTSPRCFKISLPCLRYSDYCMLTFHITPVRLFGFGWAAHAAVLWSVLYVDFTLPITISLQALGFFSSDNWGRSLASGLLRQAHSMTTRSLMLRKDKLIPDMLHWMTAKSLRGLVKSNCVNHFFFKLALCMRALCWCRKWPLLEAHSCLK